jgi:hypothetical protein
MEIFQKIAERAARCHWPAERVILNMSVQELQAINKAIQDSEKLRAEVWRLKGVIGAEMLETGSCGTGAARD